VRLCGHEAPVTALIEYVEILELLQPSNFRSEPIALLGARDNAHNESAIEKTCDRTLELAEMIDGGESALAYPPDNRGRESDRLRRNIDGATGKRPALATRVAVVREDIVAGNADDDASMVAMLDNHEFVGIRVSRRHGGSQLRQPVP
jgi:hypothetical protein